MFDDYGNGDEQIDLIVQAPIGQGKTPNFRILSHSLQFPREKEKREHFCSLNQISLLSMTLMPPPIPGVQAT
jgi:hypothetical protein